MKRILVLVILSLLFLSTVHEVGSPEGVPPLPSNSTLSPEIQSSTSSVSGGGSSQTATMFFNRIFTDQHLEILNTYGDTITHSADLDLSAYQVSGWRLSNVQIDTENISAATEKEVLGVDGDNFNFLMEEHGGTWYSQLAQGFYNQSHDGVLVNYSIYYITLLYDADLRNNASFVIRSGSSSDLDSATDITTPVNMTASNSVYSWATVSGNNTALSADTVYWAVIDGSSIIKAGAPTAYYPTIYWVADSSNDVFGSYTRGGTVWDYKSLEALMNYTYIPWNQTANSPLTYTSPQEVSLKVNSSTITSSIFRFSSATKNITSISFDTNQSVYFNYNMTLSYVKDSSTAVSWNVASSGSLVDWSIEVGTVYPSVTGQVSKYLNISKANSWTITGLYEDSAPTTNHTDYTLIGTTVLCGSMTDGTWKLAASSYNHLSALHTYDSSDDSELFGLSSILMDIDVNLTILEQDSDPVSTGLANLTIVKGGSIVWFPSNKSVSDGKANYLWNIDSTSSDNGAYTLEVSWANGTDAGYLVQEFVVYYPTTLTATESNIDAFTESTFEVRVYFEDNFTPQGLYGAGVDVMYSFDGGSNVSTGITDHNNGTWTALVPTTGKDPGTYFVDVYAEGYALQNQSVQVNVNLIHDSETLSFLWSNTNNITYIETTELSVYYNRVTGSTPIPDATVNVTIDTKTWSLVWDEVSAYKITFNGTDIPPGFASHNLVIEAWKDGHREQSDSIQTLIIQEEPTKMVYEWSNGDDITYIDSTKLRVNYTMSNGSAVVGATVNVTIDLVPYYLDWNVTSETYDYVFDGDASLPGISNHILTINADLFGYADKNETLVPLTISEEPTNLVITWSAENNISYVEETLLIANYTMSDGSPVIGAGVNVTIGVYAPWQLVWDSQTQTYRVLFSGSDIPPGLGIHTLTILADLAGFTDKSNISQMVFREESTKLNLLWSNTNNITFIEQTTLSANYIMSNGTPIRNAVVNVSVAGNTPMKMIWHEGSLTYRITFNGTDNPPGFGSHSVLVLADIFGYKERSNSSYNLILTEESTSIIISWFDESVISFVQQTTLSVTYRMNDSSPVTEATVSATIIGYDPFVLVWNIDNQAYEYTFKGSDNPPGLGVHDLTIDASKFGYETQCNGDKSLTINIELTSLNLIWVESNNITYVEYTILNANFTMSNGSAVVGAFVNATIGSVERTLEWNSTSKLYTVIIRGNDSAIGLTTHSVVVQATLFGYQQQTNSTQTLTINKESTSLVITWSNGNDLSFYEHTYLFVNYRMNNFSTIRYAMLNVTTGSGFWLMQWNETAGMYQVRFNGSDLSPGVGFHELEIRADRFGYVSQADFTQNLTLPVIPTSIQITWSNTDTITFLGQTMLSVEYTTDDHTVIQGATVNITIDLKTWTLDWNFTSGAYEITFNGTDNPPGLGIHSTSIEAWKEDFEGHTKIAEVLTINDEPTVLVISWSNGNNVSYVSGTTLSVRYQLTNTTPIIGATVNATIEGLFRILTWNPVSEAYEAYFAGDDDPPGYHTHTVEIRANKQGYEYIFDNSQEFIITLEETSISFEWEPSSTITYVEHTKIRIFYLMSNTTPIVGATVNVTIGLDRWDANWNDTSKAYEITWLGTANPPGLDSHTLVIRAWKVNYVGITNISQTLTLNEEPTQIVASWSNGNSITYSNSTTLLVTYRTSNETVIPSALVNVTIGADTWILDWNSTSHLYEITFDNESIAWPGLGTFGLTIRGWLFGYEIAINATQTLTINSEQVIISSELLNGSTITYIGYTIFEVNYTTTDGTPISGAIVNVTISGHLWNLTWHAISETYRIQFNGSDTLPGFGIHNLIVNASSYGFDGLTDTLQTLTIIEEPTTLTVYWGAPNFNSVTYFNYTVLNVNYQMSDGSDLSSASVNVTIDFKTWTLNWNSTATAYTLRFNGSDSPPGFGTHSLLIEAGVYGFADASNSSQSLTLARDPTTIEVSWTNSNNITYVEYTILSVIYKMSNGSDIIGATVNATIGADPWILTWNETASAYQIRFDGNQTPPGLGTFTVNIHASSTVFIEQNPSTTLTLRTESTTATPSWTSVTIDWTENVILSFDFRDSYGQLIEDATTKSVYVDSVEHGLLGTNGTYWIEFDNSFELGPHSVWANFSKFGYDSVTALSIDFTIIEAQTDLTIVWSTTSIDYLGQIDLAVDYYYLGSGASVPSGGVVANITIDGTITMILTLQGGRWIANLTGVDLDLGSHDIDIRAQVYGYEFSESLGIVLTVNEVSSDALVVTWIPSNITIAYTDSLNLTIDYTYYGGDIPDTAVVNVSIDVRWYNLTYSMGIWSVSIPGAELDIGIYTATISAWCYGYQYQTNVTSGINVTLAANSFKPTWEPSDLQATYINIINLTVTYTKDWLPIEDATINLSINGTIYPLTFSDIDDLWHFSMDASEIGLGIWNVTVTANKTGYSDGWDSQLLTISLTQTNLTIDLSTTTTIYYDESIALSIYYQLMNTSYVPGSTCTVTMDSIVQSTSWDTDHWVLTLSGVDMGLGVHSIVIDVDAFGYESNTDSFDVTVNAIPTGVIVDSVTYTVYPFDSVTVSFTWIDSKNLIGITGIVPDVIWPDTYDVVDLGNGTYHLELDNSVMHIGTYDLNVTFTSVGYIESFRSVSIEILELPIVLTFDDEIEQFENETITVSIQISDEIHTSFVDWGEIAIELDGVQYSLVYDSDSQVYTVDIWLSDLEPSLYILNFTASATDCETQYGEIQLTIDFKVRYTIVLEVDDEIQAGQTIQIIILASYESGTLEGFQATVHIVVERGELAPLEFMEVASDILEFIVPSDATKLTIWAEFEGAIGEWDAISNTIIREVTPGGISSIFENPVTLSVIFGGGGGSIAGLILLRRRRRVGVSTTSVPTSAAAPIPTPSAPSGEMELLQQRIMGNPVGLTRAQIAQSLEISTSKAGAMVRKLLESDSTFEEVREGRLRRIRFRSEE